MGKASRDKGYRGERNLVNHLKKFAFDEVERVPLSGGSRYSKNNKGDVTFKKAWSGITMFFRGEVKIRADGFKELYSWLFKEKDTNILFVKADNRPYLVVMTLPGFIALCERKDVDVLQVEDPEPSLE